LEEVQLFQDSTESNSLEDFLGSAPDWSQLSPEAPKLESQENSQTKSEIKEGAEAVKGEKKSQEEKPKEAVEDVDEEWFSSN
jgi:hypothetical protein